MRIVQKKYPKDHLVSPWSFQMEKARDKESFVIRRQIKKPDGKRTWERLSKDYYRHISNNEIEVKDFVIRLNGRDIQAEKAKAKWEIKHAYINSKLLHEFAKVLEVDLGNKARANTYYGYFRRYFLDFFTQFSPDPLEWHTKYQMHWKEALLNPNSLKLIKDKHRILKKGELRSVNTIKRTISAANSFMKFLHQQLPAEVAELTFRPLKKSDYKNLQAKREMLGLVKGSKYIEKADLIVILENLPSDIDSPSRISQKYGLREAETLGLINKLPHVKKGYLYIESQLDTYNPKLGPTFAPLKGRIKCLKVPHWYSKPKEIYELIQGIHPMCASTLSRKFSEYTKKLFEKKMISQHYTFHDFRCTYITDATDDHPIKDVQFAVGHSQEKITEGYKKDKRSFDDETWTPIN